MSLSHTADLTAASVISNCRRVGHTIARPDRAADSPAAARTTRSAHAPRIPHEAGSAPLQDGLRPPAFKHLVRGQFIHRFEEVTLFASGRVERNELLHPRAFVLLPSGAVRIESSSGKPAGTTGTCHSGDGDVGGNLEPTTARKTPGSGLAPPSHSAHRVECKRRAEANTCGTTSPARRPLRRGRLASPS
jgi:hypothetical protein